MHAEHFRKCLKHWRKNRRQCSHGHVPSCLPPTRHGWPLNREKDTSWPAWFGEVSGHRTQVFSPRGFSNLHLWISQLDMGVAPPSRCSRPTENCVFPSNTGSPNGVTAHRLTRVQLALDANPIHATGCIRIPGMWWNDQLNWNRRGRCRASLLLGITGCWTKCPLQEMLEDGDVMTEYRHYLHYLQHPHETPKSYCVWQKPSSPSSQCASLFPLTVTIYLPQGLLRQQMKKFLSKCAE